MKATLISMLALLLPITLGASQSVGRDKTILGEVRTRRLVIVDEKGDIRATLGDPGKPNFGLRLFDYEGKVRTELSVNRMGPQLCLYDDGGRLRLRINTITSQVSTISLYDREGIVRAVLSADDLGKANLKLPGWEAP